MWKWWLLAFLIFGSTSYALLMLVQGPDITAYQLLKNPRISIKPDTQVLEIPFQVTSAKLPQIFKLLIKTYFRLAHVPKGPGMAAPVARYENSLDLSLSPEQQARVLQSIVWKGTAALALPATVKELPANSGSPDTTPRLAIWKYGEVAEILHQGPYAAELPTVKRLIEYISAQGYEIIGLHEEEYLRGPGMLFDHPKNYYTIIRYPVKKKTLTTN